MTFLACNKKNKTAIQKSTVNNVMLDSIKKASDSIYTKPYFSRDFAKADYFKNTKDTTLTQVMRDKNDTIRQVIITKNKMRIFFAQYYSNGQLMAKYQLDNYGQYNGYCEEYFENSGVKTSGNYHSGFHTGSWKNFDKSGNHISTDEYNMDGQLIKSIKE